MRKRTGPLTIMLCVALFMVGCSQLSSEQEKAASDAIRALRKIEAATQVGVNYQFYGQMLIEAKAEVNEAISKLPDGELKSELISAVDAYAEAGEVWGFYISDKSYPDTRLADSLRAHYDIEIEPEYGEQKEQQKSEVLSKIWAAARNRLNKASSLLQK